jgi:hypothetical protein
MGMARQQERLARIQDDPKMLLTDVEKYTLELLIVKQQELQQQMNKIAVALSGTISQAVTSRGLNPKNWGVNLGVGKVLPIDAQPIAVPKDGGSDPEKA